ncbi:MAG TPA: dienelactone hydrolase family protein [Sphingobium sp.]|uniref:dienelactone hydrolase family protein n=1 Tax=Sphingobium sp. TaxID=1912891 RepID=UPI002ED3095A
MPYEKIMVTTGDGQCPVHILTPDGDGPWPAIFFYMDALAIRPAIVDMAARLAGAGYLVLVPDIYYRSGPYAPLDPKEVFAGDFRAIVGPMRALTGNDKAVEDTRALLAYFNTREDVAGSRVGTVGFCMGGGMALSVAGAFPDRVGAAASFHGGNLATDEPTSPHRLAPGMTAEVYVAGADNDKSYPPEEEARLDRALTDAGVRHRCEIYPGAAHGWMKPDFPVYDEAAAERGWDALLDLFGRNLR